MGFKRTPEGRVFFSGANGANNDAADTEKETAAPRDQTIPSPNKKAELGGELGANDLGMPLRMNARRNQAKAQQNPQMRSALTNDKSQNQIVNLLKTLNERLKMTQAERDTMQRELDKYRDMIEELEDKSNRNERIALDLEHKIEQQAKQNTAVMAKAVKAIPKAAASATAAPNSDAEKLAKTAIEQLAQTRKTIADMQRRQNEQTKALSEKVIKSSLGMTALQRRVEDTENRQTTTDEKIDNAMIAQSKLMRRVDKAIEDRARFMRKIERIEETVLQTRDSLNAKAMVLLTDQEAARESIEDTDIATEKKGLLSNTQPQKFQSAQARAAQIAESIGVQNDPADKNADKNQTAPTKNNSAKYLIAASLIALTLVGGALAYTVMRPQIIARPSANTTTLDQFETSRFQSQNTSQNAEVPPLPSLQSPTPIEDLQWRIDEPRLVADSRNNLTAASVPNVDLNDANGMNDLMRDDPAALAAALNQIEPERTPPAPVQEVQETQQIAALTSPPAAPEAPAPVQAPAQAQATPIAPPQIAAPTPRVNTAQADQIATETKPDPRLPNTMRPIEEQAFQGIGEAQHDLAAIYTAGHGGVAQDYTRASYWFEKAAQNGIANAAYNLAVMYHQGIGVDTNVDAAMQWYKQAAAQGHPEAQYNLGFAAIEGIGVPYDPSLAAQYFESAANAGVVEAAYNLGLIYENGLLGQPDPQAAIRWFQTAADQGSVEADYAMQELARKIGMPLDKAAVSPASFAPPSSTYATNTGVSEQALIAQIQEYLMSAGLYPGPADGISGALTEDAIRSYQSTNSLNTDGRATNTLLSHMLSNEQR